MTRVRLSQTPPERPGDRVKNIDNLIATLSAIKDPDARCRALKWYVHWLLEPWPKLRGRLANPETFRQHVLSDWDVFDAVENIRRQGRARSIADACVQLADDCGLRGKAPESGLRKAYYRHIRGFSRSQSQTTW
jgi:hypothetical protein